MRLRRVLVILKETSLAKLTRDRTRGTRRLRQLLRDDAASVQTIKAAHEEHAASVVAVRAALVASGLEFREVRHIPKRPISGWDLVVTIGGDGLVLGASHAVRDDTPILGVNSAPTFSVGYLTGCQASGVSTLLDSLRQGEAQPLDVQRLRVRLGRRDLPEPVLNDVLFCADNPASMSRYRLLWPDGEEMQRSSGIWVATPAGSTSAMASAGGPILPITAKQFAFLVREPYAPPGMGVRVRSAVLAKEEVLALECRTLDASIFLDGSHRRHPVHFGERVGFSLHPQPLRLVRSRHMR